MSGFFSLGPIFCSFCFCLIFLRLDGVLLTTLAPAICFCLVCGALLNHLSFSLYFFQAAFLFSSLWFSLLPGFFYINVVGTSQDLKYFLIIIIIIIIHHSYARLVLILSEIQSHFTSASRTCKNLTRN